MKYVIVAAVAVVFILALLFICSYRIAKELVIPVKKENSMRNSFPHEKRFKVQSSNGYAISCRFIPIDDGMSMNERIVILLHQFNSNKEEISRYASIFTSMGFSVLVPDMRAHGGTGGNTSSMGYFETKDLSAVVRWLKDCYGSDVYYGLFGLCDGGVTALLYAGTDRNVKFVIADTPFSDLRDLYKHLFKVRYNIKTFPMLNLTEAFIKKIAGFEPKKISPLKLFEGDCSFPMMLIHGDCDKQVSPLMSVDLYNAKDLGPKTLYLAPESGHLEAFTKNETVYIDKIHTFIRENTDSI